MASMIRTHAFSNQYAAALWRPASHHDGLARDIRADVCIVGAGIAGSAAALALAKSGRDVVVLERETVSYGASGQNMGFVLPLREFSTATLHKAYGAEWAPIVHAEAQKLSSLAISTIEKLGIDCELRRGVLIPARNEKALATIGDGLRSLREDFGDRSPIDEIDGATTRCIIDTDRYVGGFMRDIGHLNPLKLTLGVADAAVAAGARFFEHTSAIGTDQVAQGVEVTTSTGFRVRADRVLIATNAYLTNALFPELARRYIPLYAACIATRPLKPTESPMMPGTAVSEFIGGQGLSFRMTGQDDCLLFGGTLLGSTNDEVSRRQLTKRLRETFPHRLKGVEIAHHWGGWLAVKRFSDAPDIGMLRPRIHFVLGTNIAWSLWHGPAFAQHLHGGSEAYARFEGLPHGPMPARPILNLALQGLREAVGRLDAL